MSEVKRWKLKGFIPGVDGESRAIFQPVVVLAEDFDNATRLFLDAAERCVASERREKELQQRLTATGERADLLEGLLRTVRAKLSFDAEDVKAIDAALRSAVAVKGGSTCNQIREESDLPTNHPCQACGHGACIDR